MSLTYGILQLRPPSAQVQHGSASTSSRRWWLVPLVLLTLSAVIIILRLRTFSEPFERDLITYMMVGHAMNQGGQAYVDGWEIKPPAIYAVYALAEWAVGYGELQVYLLNVVSAVITLIGVYMAGATFGRNAGLGAALFWVLLCGAPSLKANQPNTEVFINGCVVWALALLLRASGSSGGAIRAVAVGLLFAVGTTFKQIVIVDAMLLSCAHVAFANNLQGGRRRAIRDVLIIASVGAICWLTLIGYFSATGRFDIFYVTNFSNARAYAGNPLLNFYRYVRETRFFPKFLWFSAPVAGLVLLGALRDRRALMERPWGLYLTALVALQIKIAMNGTGFLPHYYQYWLPMLAIGAGWAVGGAKTSQTRSPVLAWNIPLTGAIVAAFLLVQQGYFYFLPADEWSHFKYGTEVLEGAAPLAARSVVYFDLMNGSTSTVIDRKSTTTLDILLHHVSSGSLT